MRVNIAAMRPYLHNETIILSATKGLENLTFLRMTEVIQQERAHELPADDCGDEGGRA